jgi:hypothetical protein
MPLTCQEFFCPDDGSCIKRPLQAEGLSPFVRMSFPAMNTGSGASGGQTFTTIDPNPAPDLTVGNKSNAPNHHAVIRSFQYGQSDGNGAEVEVFDEEGGEFDLFVNKIVKVLSDGNDFGCQVEWGWAIAHCNGSFSVVRSSPHYFLILSVGITFQSTGMMFKLELQDLMEPLFETRPDDTFENVTLKKAIEELFTVKANPKLNSVKFKRFTPHAGGQSPCNNLVDNNDMGNQTQTVDVDSMDDFKFKGALENSVAEKWECKNITPLGAVREWLKDKMTDRDRGTIIFWNSVSAKPELVVLEDPLPKCWGDLAQEQCSRSLGTYIVNGGKDSPVLSFDPQIKFNFAAAAKAGAGVDNESARGENERGQPCPEGQGNQNAGPTRPGGGDTTFVQMNEAFNQIYGPGNIRLALQGVAAQSRANKTYENIEAELRIQGDPTLDNPFTIKVKTVSLVVVNPFHLRNNPAGGNFGGCPEWLVGPPCNQVLSNKNWFIKGVSHEIKEGSFTTTLKLYLPAPGQTVTP